MVGTACFDIWYSMESESVCRLGVEGELDVETAPHLIDYMTQLKVPASRLCLDLSGVTFIDCTGLAALLGALRKARARQMTLVVDRNVSRPVRRIIEFLEVAPLVWP